MPRYDPWTNKNFGFPRKDAPAFQREWKYMNSSGVLINGIGATNQEVIKAVSGVGVSGTIYLWGCAMATTSDSAQAGHLIDDAGKEILTLCATRNGPYFLMLSTPIEIIPNSAVTFKGLASNAASYVTPLYTTSYFEYELGEGQS